MEQNPFINEQEETTEDGITIVSQEAVNYFTLPLETRLHLLHLLCEVRKYARKKNILTTHIYFFFLVAIR